MPRMPFRPDQIAQVSNFHSMLVHDYSDDYEHDRSVKHYFVALQNLRNSNGPQGFASADGEVVSTFPEQLADSGTQVQILARPGRLM